jgi:hypothetical protein
MGYPTVAEAVRGIRGLYISDDRSYSTIGFRGYSRPGDYGNRVLVLLDGQPMNDNYIWSSYVGDFTCALLSPSVSRSSMVFEALRPVARALPRRGAVPAVRA